MVAFTDEYADSNELDWRIMRDGGFLVYRNRRLLEADTDWLGSHGYEIKSVDCREWTSIADMHNGLVVRLDFPGYYGRNFNALNDCMKNDLEIKDAGLVIVLDHFDHFADGPGGQIDDGSSAAWAVLNIFAGASRELILTGKRLLTLLQSDDPRMIFQALGGVATQWNEKEWLNKDRGL